LRQKYKVYLWASVSALAIFIFCICLEALLAGEEGRVRNFILQGRRAAEAKDIFACADMVSNNYQDRYGNDRSSIIYCAKECFGYYKKILIYIEKMEIKINGSKREARVEIVATVLVESGENKKEYIFEKGKGRFGLRLVKENNKWQVEELELFEPISIMGQEVS
jgi:hypothetical protein